jgi:ABC-type transporter lipoprotein component MlaA
MPVTPRDGGQAALTVADQTIYTCPAATTMTLRAITVCNTTAAALSVTVYKVPSGQVVGDEYALMRDLLVPGRGMAVDDSVHVLEEGGKIVAHASDVGLTISLDGAEVT